MCPMVDTWVMKRQQQPRHSSNRSGCELRYVHAREYYSARKKEEILPFVITWIDLEVIMLSEIYQRTVSLICGIFKKS